MKQLVACLVFLPLLAACHVEDDYYYAPPPPVHRHSDTEQQQGYHEGYGASEGGRQYQGQVHAHDNFQGNQSEVIIRSR